MKNLILLLLISFTAGIYPLRIENPMLHKALAASVEQSSGQCRFYPVWVTAYSSTPEETDDTPFVTAQGTAVRSGVIATNLLPFGTRVQIPKLFGERIFVVEDRMNARKKDFADVWMSTKEKALAFGIKRAELVIVD